MPIPTHTLAGALPHSPDTARTWARAHNGGVARNDFDAMRRATSSWDCFRANFTWTPEQEPHLTADHDPEAAARDYASFSAEFEVTGIRMLNEFHSPWYQFGMESFAWRHRANGTEDATVSAYFKPVWTDGIIGLAFVQPPPWADGGAGGGDALTRLSRLLDVFDDAWLAGDVDAKLATVEKNTRSAIGTAAVTNGRRTRLTATTKDELAAAWAQSGRVLELERLHQYINDWVVFAGYRLIVEGPEGTTARETACLLPVGPDGLFAGELSYSLDVPSSPRGHS